MSGYQMSLPMNSGAEAVETVKETHENVIRFTPPLVIDRATIDWALPVIRAVLNMA